ncbi:NADH dehydrogenase ubiquinone 1 beta subcomplex subunit 6 [Fasciolopsis buskii]|uniref:NADH dehydrogenase ubiquinone 1 beta subcomplex subunit 6 n=1 Tax=Fasciolopsis buskii TaxID=27845 RepID=A0A8E0RSD5_9TREM|nr:NADH dehydrogenase ubiquinone 1 beta subcomplex subunit 6 [Fasciolopsis buski]
MVGSSSVSGPANSAAPVDPLVLELQKKLYKEQLIKQATVKRGSKYYPVNIEPFALERDRLALPFTEEDRALRKQWLSDQALSAREPVDIPEWTQVNVFRRAYRKPFDALARWIKPIVGTQYSRYFRWTAPKVFWGLAISWTVWYQIKYTPKTWEYTKRGIRIDPAHKPQILPGQPDFPNSPRLTRDFAMEDFDRRVAFRGPKLVTSGP